MKLRTLFALAMPLFFLSSCGPDFFMLKGDTKPEIKADTEKATLVIYRGTKFGYKVVIDNFIDNKFIGQTQGKCYFITKVDPGSHYLIGASENNSCAKITLEAGKIYYVMQGIYPGVMFARTGYSASNPEDFAKDLAEDLDYFSLMTDKELPTMDEDDYKETCADFDKEAQEDPEKHKDMLELKGY